MKAEIIAKLEEALQQADISAVSTEVKHLQRAYEQAFSKEVEKARQEFIDDGGKARDFEFHKTAEDKKIVELLTRFREAKKVHDDRISKEQDKNLEIKTQIVQDIADLSKLEVNVGSAIKKLNELQQKWKDTGAVSSHKYKDLQAEYSKAVEGFYYNLNIYRALQEHDLKKNFEFKTEVIRKVKALSDIHHIKEIENLIKIYRNEWEEIGPVPQDNWEGLKAEYRTALDDVYKRVKDHYKALEEKQEVNLQGKKEMVNKAMQLVEAQPANEEEWKKVTDELLAIQEEYKKIGKTEQKSGDEVWRMFREVCDGFFDRKKVFYDGLREKYAEAKKKKSDLIQQAEAIKDSTVWKETTDKLVKLQEAWKRVGPAGNEEHKLFARFRKACNTFFDAKRQHFDALDASFATNLTAKEAIIAQLQAFELSGEDVKDREQLKQFSQTWNEAGMVPLKEKNRVNDAFYSRLDELYDKMNIQKQEMQSLKFKNKMDRMMQGENPEFTLKKEIDFLKRQMDEINAGLRTYENNLGFFKNSKGKNDLLKDVEQKMEADKARLKEVKEKYKTLSDALASLRVTS